jgi:hypothetical protein
METWPSRLGQSQMRLGTRDLGPKVTAPARPRSNCTSILQTRPLVREGIPQQETHNFRTVLKMWPWASDGCPTLKQTCRLTVCSNKTSTLTAMIRLLSVFLTANYNSSCCTSLCLHVNDDINVRDSCLKRNASIHAELLSQKLCIWVQDCVCAFCFTADVTTQLVFGLRSVELKINDELEGNGGLIEVVSQYLCGRTEGNYDKHEPEYLVYQPRS